MHAVAQEGTLQVRVGAGSESAHWYVPGSPVECAYEIMGANGKWRAPTLRDARKYGWFPGVTSIIRQVATPALEQWKMRQSIMAALTHPTADSVEDMDERIRMILVDSKEEARRAAERGTQIHAAVEQFFRTGNVNTDYAEYVTGVRKVLCQLTGIDDPAAWSTEDAVCHPFGFGSRVDLYSESLGWIVDFKGKEFGPKDTPKGYPEQGRQLSAYKEMLKMPKANTVNLFISRNHPGLVYPYKWDQNEHPKLWRAFCYLLGYWQVDKDMPLLVKLPA